MDRAGLKIGLLAGLIGISCCVSPVVMVLLGLASGSLAISLGNTLYYQYGWYFRGAALVLAGAGVIAILRGRDACTLTRRASTVAAAPHSGGDDGDRVRLALLADLLSRPLGLVRPARSED